MGLWNKLRDFRLRKGGETKPGVQGHTASPVHAVEILRLVPSRNFGGIMPVCRKHHVTDLDFGFDENFLTLFERMIEPTAWSDLQHLEHTRAFGVWVGEEQAGSVGPFLDFDAA
jgi:hypothetical protein